MKRCVNQVTTLVFDKEFIKTRAAGHNSSVESYTKGYRSIKETFTKEYKCIVYGLVKICFVK